MLAYQAKKDRCKAQERFKEKIGARKLLFEVRKKNGDVWSVMETLEENYYEHTDMVRWCTHTRLFTNSKMICVNGRPITISRFSISKNGRVEIYSIVEGKPFKSFIEEDIQEIYVNPESPFGRMTNKITYSI